VSNGYGKRVYERNVTSAKAFSGRVRGPEDHNNLVLRRGGEIVRELPVCSALLQQGQSGELAYATGALLGYGGLDWFRTLVVLSGRFVLSLDRIRAGPEWRDSGHVEWNCPGEVDRRANGFRVSQEGVYFDVTSASGWQAEQGVSDRSASWKNVLESGAYPHAKWPLKKLVYNMPSIGGGGSASLTVLLAATREAAPRYRISEAKPGLVMIEAVDGGLPVVNVDDNDLSIRGGGGAIAIRFAAAPELPSALRSWAANE
jgi:hypothetical protein